MLYFIEILTRSDFGDKFRDVYFSVYVLHARALNFRGRKTKEVIGGHYISIRDIYTIHLGTYTR